MARQSGSSLREDRDSRFRATRESQDNLYHTLFHLPDTTGLEQHYAARVGLKTNHSGLRYILQNGEIIRNIGSTSVHWSLVR